MHKKMLKRVYYYITNILFLKLQRTAAPAAAHLLKRFYFLFLFLFTIKTITIITTAAITR